MKFSLGSRWLLLTLTYWSATAVDAIDGVFLGPPGNTCPSGSIKIMSKKKCSNIGKEHDDSIQWNKGIEEDENWPSGCYHCNEIDDCTDGTWFNKHPTGSSNGDATPWCMTTQPVPLLFVGDSDIAGWDTDIAFPNSENVGVGGWTCKQVLNNIDSFLAKHSPDTVVLVCGENDFGDGASVNPTFDKFKRVVRKINAIDARVIYMGTKPEPDTGNLHRKYRKYDRKIRSHARRSKTNLTMVDVYKSFKDLGNNDTLYDATDGLHLSEEGYVLWTGWAKQALDTDDCVEWRSGSCVIN